MGFKKVYYRQVDLDCLNQVIGLVGLGAHV